MASIQVNGETLKINKFEVQGKGYMLLKVAEKMFYPSSTSTGAFSKLLKRNGLGNATRVTKANLPDGVDMDTYETMHAAMVQLQHAIEPTQPRIASSFSIIMLESVEQLCKVSSEVHSLSLRMQVQETLGFAVPEVMAKEKAHAELEREGYVDLLLDDELNVMHDDEATLQQELDRFEPYEPSNEDDAKLESYKLNPVPRHLMGQLESFTEFQTKTLECKREGVAVSTVTAASDVATFLRFAGWRDQQMTCLSMCLSVTASEVQAFTSFLIDDRRVSYGTVANYLNSLLNMLSYISVKAQSLESIHPTPFNEADFHTLCQCTKNLRQQAESKAKQDKMHKQRKPDWISWAEAKETRRVVMQRLKEMPTTLSRKNQLTLLTDALIINLFTIMPPDRCSVIRLLSVAETLKQEGDGNYYIDLKRFQHKTARFYGPSMTPISPLITALLKRFLDETQSNFEFTEYGADEEHGRTYRRYLFAQQGEPTQPLASSQWCTRVKASFRRHSPEGKAPCPTLLRSSFITALRSSNASLATLQSAAIAQKHSIETQSSDVYDLEHHRRATGAAMKWCHEFAEAGIEAPAPAAPLAAGVQLALPVGAALEAQKESLDGNNHSGKRTADESWVTQTHRKFSY